MSQKKQFTILLSKSEKVFEVSAKKYSFQELSQRTIVEGFYKPDDLLWQTINPFDYPQHDAKSPAVVPRMGCKSLSAASKTLCIHHSSCLFPSNWQHMELAGAAMLACCICNSGLGTKHWRWVTEQQSSRSADGTNGIWILPPPPLGLTRADKPYLTLYRDSYII